MDKLKPYIAGMKKYNFWIFCIAVVVGSLGVWFWAVGQLKGEYQTRAQALDGAFEGCLGVMNRTDQPNQKMVDAINSQKDDVSKGVETAWEDLYRTQRADNQLPADLTPGFKTAFNKLIAGKIATLGATYRRDYLAFIGAHYQKLLTKLGRYVPATGTAGGTRGGGGGAALDPFSEGGGGRQPATGTTPPATEPQATGVVIWEKPEILELTKDFEGKPADLVTDQEIIDAQEDLWVYEALLKIIRDMNVNATSPRNAKVRRIDALQIRYPAFEEFGEAEEAKIVELTATGGATARKTGGDLDKNVKTGPPKEKIRYVQRNDAGKFVLADPTAKSQSDPEFRLMPVRMRLLMDPAAIPELLAGCGNSAMQIEVTRFRMNPDLTSEPLKLGELIAWAKKKEGEMPEVTQTRRTTSRGRTPVGAVELEGVTVEVLGVIRIYNRPPGYEEKDPTNSADGPATPDTATPDTATPDTATPDATSPHTTTPEPTTQPTTPTIPPAPAGPGN